MPPGSLLPLAVLLCALAAAQQLPIRTYTVADGLAEDRVNRIVADSHGFIWIATAGGLSRFDGYRMKTYGVEDGLPYRTIGALAETPSGAYLIGSMRGLCRLEKRGVQPFTSYPLERQTPDIEAFLTEPSGRILIGSSIGLFEADNAMSFRKLPLSESVGAGIKALARDHDGNVWISAEKALGILAPGGELTVFQPGHGLPLMVGHAAAMLEQPAGRMWAATNAGLALFERPDGGKWRFSRMFTTASGLAGDDVGAMETDAVGRLWVGTSEGISRFAPDGPLPPHFENSGMAQGLSGRRITALAKDPGGNMWAGTENAGVMRIARQGFLTYREADGLKNERILQVLEDRAGELLTVTTSGIQPRSIGIFDGVKFRSSFPGILSSDVGWNWQRTLLQAKTGEWWFASTHGLVRFPPVKAADLATARPILYPENNVFHLFEDSPGGIWGSASLWPGPELVRWDPRSQALSWYCADGTTAAKPCVFQGLVSAMAEDPSHQIWMGLWTGGLLRYADGRFTRFGASEGIPSGIIHSLFVDSRGWLWIATSGGGLALLADPSAPRPHFDVYNKARGLSSNNICCMAEDRMGRLYLGTPRGVDRLDPETVHVREFSALDGAPAGGYTSAIRDRSGAIWFASRTGVSRLVPESSSSSGLPDVRITGLQAGGDDYAVSQLGEARVAGLRLGPSRNSLQVDFVAPGNESGETLRYKFKLTGADKSWSQPRERHTVDYRNLGAGSYQFLVKAVDPDGHESVNPAEVDFTILPPLWLRWWSELGMLCAALALAYSLHTYRLKNILAMERMRTTIATDLHDDIGASLAQIAVWSRMARIDPAADPPHSAPMARIATLAGELTDSMSDIVWSIRSGDENLDSLTRRMREFAAGFLESAGIELQWDAVPAPPKLKLTLNSRRQIFLVFKECIHNIVKHSGCRSVWIAFEIGDREAVMTVADDGKGLEEWRKSQLPMARRAGNGLPSMLRRAESLGGTVEFGIRPGGGCQITLRVPVQRRPFAAPAL